MYGIINNMAIDCLTFNCNYSASCHFKELATRNLHAVLDYWRSRENPLGFSHGMKGQNLLPLCTQVGFSQVKTFLFHKRPIELAEAQDVYAWVSHLIMMPVTQPYGQDFSP